MCIRDRIKTIQAVAKFLENYEHEGQYQRNRMSVSYTHLDVYKRQLTTVGLN